MTLASDPQSAKPVWSQLSHAYGPADETPTHLKNLLSPDWAKRAQAMEHLWSAVLHQGTIYPVTAPVVREIAVLLSDPGTLVPEGQRFDSGQPTTEGQRRLFELIDATHATANPDEPPHLLRERLIDFLAVVAESATFEPPGPTYETLAAPKSPEVEGFIAALWRGDYEATLSDAVPEDVQLDATNASIARAVLKTRSALAAIVPNVLDQLAARELGVRRSAANAAAKIAKALQDPAILATTMERLEGEALDAESQVRASSALSIGELGGKPTRLLSDADFLVRSCAALAPALASDSKATRQILEAIERPREIDELAKGLPAFAFRPRFSFAQAAADRASSFEDLVPGALKIAEVASAYTVDREVGPLLTRAFPEPYRAGQQLSPEQLAFLRALVANEKIWDTKLINAQPWFKKVGLPYDRDGCAALLSGR